MSYIWDDVGRSWRPVRQGEAGEFYWDGTSWVPNPIGGNFVWTGTATGWAPGPGGTHEWVQADRAWRPETSAAGGEHFWNGTAWEPRLDPGTTPAKEIFSRSGLFIVARDGSEIVGR